MELSYKGRTIILRRVPSSPNNSNRIVCSWLQLPHNYMRDLICYLLPMDLIPSHPCE
ncbi:hypothetical protein KIN20_022148 [Parelaphostrongylus tenuis]|uniref:Uncharacterized protein n=1 Tax=Parelaphostrongylus tenuis TaxID=148309 RepID=A0AAD5MV29_PARTN|nr:hypothetical protein KIN20_022148 [Parelaphostrongylus tenuis]